MIDLRRVAVLTIFLASATSSASPPSVPAPEAPVPADFKLEMNLYGVRKPPIVTAELVVRNGVAYQFVTEGPEEVTIVDPRQGRLQLFDLVHHIHTEVTARQLDTALGKARQKGVDTIERQEKAGGRANRVSAAMIRDQIDPHFTETYDPSTHRLRLTNATIEIDALGQPEPEQARLSTIVDCLSLFVKLAVLREPESLPTITRLDTLRILSEKHRLRPVEISVLYRLSGPPRKLRWTYRLVPGLTERERDAISKVDQMRSAARFVPFERYEEIEEKEKK